MQRTTTIPSTLGFPTGPLSEGTVYPGENWMQPSGKSDIFTLKNVEFMNDKDRLYVGVNGRQVNFSESAADWAGGGAVFSLSLEVPDAPAWLNTLTIPQDYAGETHVYAVNGLAVLPNQATWLTPMRRNIVAVLARDTQSDNLGGVGLVENRLVLAQDPE